MSDTATLTIVHELPGRLRMKVSQALETPEDLASSVKGHAGIVSVAYTPVTHSILVRFDHREIAREEIIIRVGLSLALDFGSVPVQIFDEPKRHDMSDSAVYSGMLLVVALVNRFGNRQYRKGTWLEWAVGLGTAWAVFEHGASEVKERGNFDPEVLSVVYLVTALLKGNFLPSAIFTWLTTFGRHLIHLPSSGIELRPISSTDKHTSDVYHEVVISPVKPTSEKLMLFRLLPSIIKYAASGKMDGKTGDLLDEIRRVSDIHGEVIEGLGGLQSGIPLKIR